VSHMEENKKKKGCPKCGCEKVNQSEIATTGTGLSKLFDIQHNQFKVVSCANCGYSEFYNMRSSGAMNVLDFFFGG